MPQKAKYKLTPLILGSESVGQRITLLRKERGYTQKELSGKIGITQKLLSAYEVNRLKLSAEMAIRLASALEVSVDELFGLKSQKNGNSKPSLKILRRLKKIESLPTSEQKTLLKTIDMFLKAAEK
ncbi:MAG: helix-turn-helix transcriptional regulator [Candidatus Scalindua sp.]|jgi:transcriptional regulator with XRE-family HTH domain|nr:helix-turn-helix transcriptional regulator [Candidatus Scalindua sp.]MBT5305899.1 helix-turn-helix transcriptional regulator [Candidatus Scalindua sp.]MBT6052006.1 helix-turn-helix transcriptional regulator [Candidatus Scalindua sp.]MBT6229147.1 helix-turn-helix transcriptional regulator [Candidatus Scalindua sp.]MBT6564776.1 helix-turn-helix transcriptional regulator [Candidatus Scalindua sp.]